MMIAHAELYARLWIVHRSNHFQHRTMVNNDEGTQHAKTLIHGASIVHVVYPVWWPLVYLRFYTHVLINDQSMGMSYKT